MNLCPVCISDQQMPQNQTGYPAECSSMTSERTTERLSRLQQGFISRLQEFMTRLGSCIKLFAVCTEWCKRQISSDCLYRIIVLHRYASNREISFSAPMTTLILHCPLVPCSCWICLLPPVYPSCVEF